MAIQILLAGALAATPAQAPADRVLVVFPSGVEACEDAVETMRQELARAGAQCAALDLKRGDFEKEMAKELAAKPRLMVAVGTEALRAVSGLRAGLPVLTTMTLQADSGRVAGVGAEERAAAAVYLDVTVPAVLAGVKRALPGKNRLGIIRNSGRGGPSAEQLREAASREGYSAQVAECTGPDGLLAAFLSLKGKADLVLCLPDSTLYNGATAKPLILASLQHRLPIIGFSSSFVRAGAAVGVYPDFQAVGRQTADFAVRCLTKRECAGQEYPKRLVVAVNQRVGRLLGIEFPERDKEVVVFR